MIVRIDNNVQFVKNTPFIIQHDSKIQKRIDSSWEEFIKDKKVTDYYNGDVYLVDSLEIGENYLLRISLSKYADLIFAKKTGAICTRSLFVASYVMTRDKKIGVIRNKRNIINTIGGMADYSDFLEGNFSPQHCLVREWKEELGIDLNYYSDCMELTQKYLKIPGNGERNIPLYPIGLLYEIKTEFTSFEMINMFNELKSRTDGEVSELIFYNQHTYCELKNTSNRVDYLFELISNIVSEI